MSAGTNFKIEIKNNNIKLTLGELASKKGRILVAWGIKAVSLATSIITKKGAVDTGRLRASITYNIEGDNTMCLGTPVEYGKYVELGTYKMKARPFILPAIKDNMNEYKSIANNILKE